MIGDEQPDLTDRHGDAGFRWLLDHRGAWCLSDSQLACLLGVRTERLLGWMEQVETGEMVRPPPDVVERIGLLLGLHKGLVNLTPSGHESMAVDWFQKPVDLLGLTGESIRSHLLHDPRTEVLIKLVRRVRASSV